MLTIEDIENRKNLYRTVRDNADAVDAEARFPVESIDMLKELACMSMLVSHGKGKRSSDRLKEVGDLCFQLSQRCAATGLIFAMHQIQVLCLLEYSTQRSWHNELLADLEKYQLLCASSTTESKTGGDARSSDCTIEIKSENFILTKDATVVSYAPFSDLIFATARRSHDAVAADQILTVLRKDDIELEKINSWTALGMRGTCSDGYKIRAKGKIGQIFDTPYSTIHAETVVPAAHLLWSCVWAGIAADAVEKVRKSLRKKSRITDVDNSKKRRLAECLLKLNLLKKSIKSSFEDYSKNRTHRSGLLSQDYLAWPLLKIASADLATNIVFDALKIAGLSGYLLGGESSLARHLRDVLSSQVMINNDRILRDSTNAVLFEKNIVSL